MSSKRLEKGTNTNPSNTEQAKLFLNHLTSLSTQPDIRVSNILPDRRKSDLFITYLTAIRYMSEEELKSTVHGLWNMALQEKNETKNAGLERHISILEGLGTMLFEIDWNQGEAGRL